MISHIIYSEEKLMAIDRQRYTCQGCVAWPTAIGKWKFYF